MSLYTEWVNQIKALASPDWLTQSQRAAYDSIAHKWKEAQFVCLMGSSGSGKSFIARLLFSEKHYAYAASLAAIPEGSECAVVDGEEYSRLMRPKAMMLNVRRVVVIGTRPPRDPMPIARIDITPKDVMEFQSNLVRARIIDAFRTDYTGHDLGELLLIEASARGCTECR